MNQDKPVNYGAVLAIYVLGLLVGGLYVGMVSPARTVIQEYFVIGDTVGILVISIYTLFYAALISVIGKLSDRYGRRKTFLCCVMFFALGSLICWCSSMLGLIGPTILGMPTAFLLLLFGRIVQAIGASGMIPVANAEVGATFPQERRGMALGIVAAVAGIANVIGTAVGSAVLGWVGSQHWGLMFALAIPICIALLVAGLAVLPKRQQEAEGKLDVFGSVIFVAMVMCLLLALNRIDFVNFSQSLGNLIFWVLLASAVILAFAFWGIEKRASDPVFHIEYLKSRPIGITMLLSFFIGGIIISMTVIPEFTEYLMDLPAGKGGYYVVVIGVFGMIGPPIAGKLIDRFGGVKPVLAAGLISGAIGFGILAYSALLGGSSWLLFVGLSVAGLGMGFTMGTPTNYMILENTTPEESGSAIGTIALVRQIGTTVTPAILVGLIGAGTAIGFRNMLLCVVVFQLIGLVLTLAYKPVEKASTQGS